jgi:3-hydroxyisobutyrate dehydrogenase-like beta-hydroxyacid dehydrogenase
MKITLIGLGKMGTALAERLLVAKAPLTVFNRTKEKMQHLIQAGAKGAETLEEAVKGAQVVVTCLLDDQAVLQTMEAWMPVLESQSIHIGTSTILPETSKKLTDLHDQKNSIYIGGTVLGVPAVAAKGELTSFVAGDTKTIEQYRWVFQSYSSTIIQVGLQPYQANVVKIGMNYLLASAIQTIGEIYTFVEKSGVDVTIMSTLFHSVFSHPSFRLYVDKIKNRQFNEVNFELKGGLKDINLFQRAFTDVHVVPGIANVIKDRLIIALAHHMEHQDWSAVTEVTRQLAHLK